MTEKAKRYFKKEFRLHMFSLEHEDSSDFYLSCWQRNRSCWPLLCIRTLIFIGCLSTVVASMVLMTQRLMNFGHWFIFMTHWGLVFNTISAALAWLISVVEFLRGPDSSPTTLVKLYWSVFNATISVAFFITGFYWALLTDLTVEADYALDPVLDVFVHGINSVFMFCLLITSRHPTRLLHFYIPLILGISYMLFSVIYYAAGGLSPFGMVWIYPMLDWSKPGPTILLSFGSAVMIIVIHFIVVGMTLAREALTKRFREPTVLAISGQNNGMSNNYFR
ncbi:hypothetical protein PYW07_007372 [Mythimna separata]|uniref:Protein rolling stone n=1 Tax=Mythimna separata TaxID=271217 RepID=A0AAD7Z1U9_MYTSE|nr:hypothetical protein PYW07_007372 [Mythimna separata]